MISVPIQGMYLNHDNSYWSKILDLTTWRTNFGSDQDHSFRQIVTSFCKTSLFLKAVTSVLDLSSDITADLLLTHSATVVSHPNLPINQAVPKPKICCLRTNCLSLLPPQTALQEHPRKSSVLLNSQLLASIQLEGQDFSEEKQGL